MMNDCDAGLYDVMRLYRNAVFSHFDTYYTNDTLGHLAESKPQSEEAFLKIAPSEIEFERYGHRFLELITIFTGATRSSSSLNGTVRDQVGYFEMQLHQFVLGLLRDRIGKNWWFEGVPESVRVNAATLYEKSKGEIPKEHTLYLMDLVKIVVKNWSYFGEIIDPDNSGKKVFEAYMDEVNDLRNKVSHPTRLKKSPLGKGDLSLIQKHVERVEEWNGCLTRASS